MRNQSNREGAHISESERYVRKKLKIEGLGNEEFLEQAGVILSASGGKPEMKVAAHLAISHDFKQNGLSNHVALSCFTDCFQRRAQVHDWMT